MTRAYRNVGASIRKTECVHGTEKIAMIRRVDRQEQKTGAAIPPVFRQPQRDRPRILHKRVIFGTRFQRTGAARDLVIGMPCELPT